MTVRLLCDAVKLSLRWQCLNELLTCLQIYQHPNTHTINTSIFDHGCYNFFCHMSWCDDPGANSPSQGKHPWPLSSHTSSCSPCSHSLVWQLTHHTQMNATILALWLLTFFRSHPSKCTQPISPISPIPSSITLLPSSPFPSIRSLLPLHDW